MFLILQCETPLGKELVQVRPKSQPARAVLGLAKKMGVTVMPLHPGIDDPEMANQFFVEVPDWEKGQRLCNELLRIDQVTAAYVKPPDALPGAF